MYKRQAAQAKLSRVYQWIERHSQDGFIDSLTHDQNLDRIADALAEKEEAMRAAIKVAHGAFQMAADEITSTRAEEAVAAALAELDPFIKP